MIRARGCEIAADFEHWPQILDMLKCVIGPSIHRSNAVVDMGDSGLGIILSFDDEGKFFEKEDWTTYDNWRAEFNTDMFHVNKRHYLTNAGLYNVMVADTKTEEDLVWIDVGMAHQSLLKLGTHLMISLEFIRERFSDRMPNDHGASYLKVWLRYPVETLVGDPTLVYVCHRVMKTKRSREWSVEVIAVPLKYVKLPEDGDSFIDFLTQVNTNRQGSRPGEERRSRGNTSSRQQHAIM